MRSSGAKDAKLIWGQGAVIFRPFTPSLRFVFIRLHPLLNLPTRRSQARGAVIGCRKKGLFESVGAAADEFAQRPAVLTASPAFFRRGAAPEVAIRGWIRSSTVPNVVFHNCFWLQGQLCTTHCWPTRPCYSHSNLHSSEVTCCCLVWRICLSLIHSH
jgi:hypothetical protein